MVPRSEYISQLEAYKDKQIIKVITGLRRSGKTTLMEIYKESLIVSGVSLEQIIHLNFEDVDNAYIEDYRILYQEVKTRLIQDKMNYVILDEVQYVSGFERAIDSLYIRKNCDVYITGSNSKLLSGDLATLLSGRYVEINVLPLSFKEYVSAKEEKSRIDMLFSNYVQTSSFPFVLQLDTTWSIQQYLSSIYDSVVLKDIIGRRKSVDVSILNRIIRFLFDSIGSEISANRIAGTLTSSGRKISVPTVDIYLKAVVDSFLFYKTERYDIKGKELLSTNPKYYAADIGLRRAVLGSKAGDAGHLLENIVYLELIRRGYKTYVGKTGNAEVDFIAFGENGPEYYQVAYTVRDADGSILERELRPLLSIHDHNPKYLLTMDYGTIENYDGIKQVYVLDWLLK